jgi:hypothetical protein
MYRFFYYISKGDSGGEDPVSHGGGTMNSSNTRVGRDP